MFGLITALGSGRRGDLVIPPSRSQTFASFEL